MKKLKDQKKLWFDIFKKQYYVENYPSEQIVRFLMRYKKNKKNKLNQFKVLDLGCGIGRHALLASEIGFDSYAIDVVSSSINIVKNKSMENNLKVNCQIGSMNDLPYNDNFFDIIISFGVFDHVLFDDAKKGINEIQRTLKKNGLVYLKLETTNSFEKKYGKKIGKNTFILTCDCEKNIIQHYFSKKEIKELFKNFTITNFEKEEIFNEFNNNIILSRWHIIAKNN